MTDKKTKKTAAVFLAGTFLVTFLADDFLAAVFLVFLSVIDEK